MTPMLVVLAFAIGLLWSWDNQPPRDQLSPATLIAIGAWERQREIEYRYRWEQGRKGRGPHLFAVSDDITVVPTRDHIRQEVVRMKVANG